jgi:predicted RNase H-like nuclease (RuvC/YqgF family)
MTDRVRTYPELIAEMNEEIERLTNVNAELGVAEADLRAENDLWRQQYERLAKHVTYYKDMWTARHNEIAEYQGVVMCLEGQIADQDNEIARLKKLADVQQNTVEFLHKLCELRTVMLNELEAKASIH